jgi:hypothetical protein
VSPAARGATNPFRGTALSSARRRMRCC